MQRPQPRTRTQCPSSPLPPLLASDVFGQSIHSIGHPIHPSIHPSIHSSIHPSIHPLVVTADAAGHSEASAVASIRLIVYLVRGLFSYRIRDERVPYKDHALASMSAETSTVNGNDRPGEQITNPCDIEKEEEEAWTREWKRPG